MRRVFRISRTILFVACGLALILGIGGLIYLNQVGFPGRSGEWVREQLAEMGIHLEFDSLRLDFEHGLVAHGVRYYALPDDPKPVLTANEIILDINRSRALRRQLVLREILVRGGETRVFSKNREEMVTVHELEGDIEIEADRRIRVRDGHATIRGVELELAGEIALAEATENTRTGEQQLEAVLRPILEELNRWELDPQHSPRLSIEMEGDLAVPHTVRTRFQLEAKELARNDYFIKELELEGDVHGQLVTVDRLILKDETGEAEAQADWHLSEKNGRFHARSALQIQKLLLGCFGVEVASKLKMASSPEVLMDGKIHQGADGRFSVEACGQVRCGETRFLDARLNAFSSSFCWKDGDIYLQGVKVTHPDGQLSGDFLAQGPDVRFKFRSSLPFDAFRPFLPENNRTARVIDRFGFTSDATLAMTASGMINRENYKQWEARGEAHFRGLSYKDLKTQELRTNFDISSKKLDFTNIHLMLDDSTESSRLRFQGLSSEPLQADAIHFSAGKLVISNLRGTTWPVPLVRPFAPKTAASIEQNYRFHQPPRLTLNGSFDCRRGQADYHAFMVTIRTTGQTDYPFLKRVLPLRDLKADVFFRQRDLIVKDLSFGTLDGHGFGEMNVTFPKGGGPVDYGGQLKWRDVSFRELSKLYEFNNEEKGQLTGRLEFEGKPGGVRQLNGRGFCSLQRGNIVAMPVFGPLSPLLAGILGDERMGYERAKDASASFIIRNGLWQTEDFVTSSRNLILTGEGWVDLADDRIDMTMRLNARGLLGVISLPLAPIKGLFQFRGTGQFTNSQWRASPFTQPRRGKQDPLFRPPAKAVVIEKSE